MRKAAALLLLVSGCGVYTFVGVEFPDQVKTVEVVPFEIKAAQVPPYVSSMLAEQIQSMFNLYTDVQTVEKNGDLIIRGAITGYDFQPVGAYTEGAQLTRIVMTVRAEYLCTVCDTPKSWNKTVKRYIDLPGIVLIQDVIPQDELERLVEEVAIDVFHGAGKEW